MRRASSPILRQVVPALLAPISMLLLGPAAHAADPDAPLHVRLIDHTVNADVPAFGDHSETVKGFGRNNHTPDYTFPPVRIGNIYHAPADATTSLTFNTGTGNFLASAWLDGAAVRIYRFTDDAVIKVGEKTIEHWKADYWVPLFGANMDGRSLRTFTVLDDSEVINGDHYWYSVIVKGVDADSARSAAVSVTPDGSDVGPYISNLEVGDPGSGFEYGWPNSAGKRKAVAQFKVQNADGGGSFELVSGALPDGLYLQDNKILGTTTDVDEPHAFTIRFTRASDNASFERSFVMLGDEPQSLPEGKSLSAPVISAVHAGDDAVLIEIDIDPADDKFTFLLNGTSAGFKNDYGSQAIKAATDPAKAEGTMTASYLFGWNPAGDSDAIGVFDDAGVEGAMLFPPRNLDRSIDDLVRIQQQDAAAGYAYDLYTYESGGGYPIPSPGKPMPWAQELIMKSLGGSSAYFANMMHRYQRGFREQCHFLFGNGRKWVSHTAYYDGFIPHAHWLMLKLYNQAVGPGADVLHRQFLSMPTDDFPADADQGYKNADADVPLADGFGMRKANGDYAVFVISRKLDDGSDGEGRYGDGAIPVSLELPFTNPQSITLYRMWDVIADTVPDARDSNVDELRIDVDSISIPTSAFDNSSRTLVVDDSTGGLTGGLPPGNVYCYVFSGVDAWTAPVAAAVTVEQAPGQMDPASLDDSPSVQFLVRFDRPVTGLDASDIVIGGDAEGQNATVSTVEWSEGTEYLVTVDTFIRAGTVTVSIPAGAAQDAVTGADNAASTSNDNVVTLTGFPGLLEFDASGLDEDGASYESDYHHRDVSAASWTRGAGLNAKTYGSYFPDSFNSNGADGDYSSAAIANEDYYTMTVSPDADVSIAFGEIALVVAKQGGANVKAALCCDALGFAAGQELAKWSVDGSRQVIDLSEVAVLSDITDDIEFRLYVWGQSSTALVRLDDVSIKGQPSSLIPTAETTVLLNTQNSTPAGWESMPAYSGTVNQVQTGTFDFLGTDDLSIQLQPSSGKAVQLKLLKNPPLGGDAEIHRHRVMNLQVIRITGLNATYSYILEATSVGAGIGQEHRYTLSGFDSLSGDATVSWPDPDGTPVSMPFDPAYTAEWQVSPDANGTLIITSEEQPYGNGIEALRISTAPSIDN